MKIFRNIMIAFTALFLLCFIYKAVYTLAEPKAYDFMTRHILISRLPFDKYKQNKASSDINLIVINNDSVTKYKWPWKREMYCKFFEYLHKYAKPQIVVYDSLILSLDADNPQSDKKFFSTLKKFDNLVVGFRPSYIDWKDVNFGKAYSEEFAKKNAVNNIDVNAHSKYTLYHSITPFPKEYLNSIEKSGSVAVVQGSIDGNLEYYAQNDVFRNHSYIIECEGKYYPSLAFAAFLKVKNNPKVIINKNNISIPDLNLKIPQRIAKYQMVTPVKFYSPASEGYSHEVYSAIDIMESFEQLEQGHTPKINPEVFKDKIVFVGANVTYGAGLDDNLSTPVKSYFPGIEYQATAADNILHNDFLHVLPDWFNILVTILGMLLVFTMIQIKELFKSITYTLGIIFAYLAFCCVCFYYCVIINVITPVVMIVLTMIAAYIRKFVLENRSKEKVKSAMGKYMSEDVMKRVIMNIDNLGLGGKKATVTVLFSDIRGFTSMSENMPAEQVSQILNEYFSEMEPIVAKYNGIINKFIGDAVMAIFGEPIQDKNHASNAVKCGYEMLLRVKELQGKWAEEGKPKIEIGIGINTGEVFVGNIGSANRMEYTVIGDAVNLASRLESYNKVYKTKMLISSSTYNETKGFIDVMKISDVEIRGKSHKMDIYEVLSAEIG